MSGCDCGRSLAPATVRPDSGSNSGVTVHATGSARNTTCVQQLPRISRRSDVIRLIRVEEESKKRIINNPQSRYVRSLEWEPPVSRQRPRDALVARLASLAYKLQMYSSQQSHTNSHQHPHPHGHHHPHHHHHYRHHNSGHQRHDCHAVNARSVDLRSLHVDNSSIIVSQCVSVSPVGDRS